MFILPSLVKLNNIYFLKIGNERFFIYMKVQQLFRSKQVAVALSLLKGNFSIWKAISCPAIGKALFYCSAAPTPSGHKLVGG